MIVALAESNPIHESLLCPSQRRNDLKFESYPSCLAYDFTILFQRRNACSHGIGC
jgi:hypothetical protein